MTKEFLKAVIKSAVINSLNVKVAIIHTIKCLVPHITLEKMLMCERYLVVNRQCVVSFKSHNDSNLFFPHF